MTPEFDHYTISRVLGEGGMGLVYLARDRRTGLPVAIKVMSRREFEPELRARFLKENRILAAMNHRNIVRCYEITESRDGAPSIVMEYVDGVDFRAFEGRPFPELLPLMIQALMGLSYLRSRNVLHRDLSSNNIFVTLENRTRVTKILDFGVAKILQQQGVEGDVRTRTGQFLGKFAFASPEHFFPAEVDWRSDVYSLGVIFHRLLTGKPPMSVARKGNYFDWMMEHEKDNFFEVVAPPGVPPFPDALRDVVRRMLARRPEDRPQSYEEILDVLDRVQRNLPPALEPDPLALRSLPPPVEGRIGSSGSGKSGPTPSSPSVPVVGVPPPSADAEASGVEPSQQMRWPDLDAPISHTERFIAASVPLRKVPDGAPPPEQSEVVEAPPDVDPSSTGLLPPSGHWEPASTAPTAVSAFADRSPERSPGTGSIEKDGRPGPASSSVGPAEEKTERLDDVLEKLRQRALLDPLPPLNPPQEKGSTLVAPFPESAPPHEPTAPPEPAPPPEPALPPRRAVASPPAAPPKAGQRLVVYGPAPLAVTASPRTVPREGTRPAAPVAPAPAARTADRRFHRIGIGLIVAAIIVLFVAVLWVLVSLLRGTPAGEPRRSGRAGAAALVAATAHSDHRPQPS